MSSPASSQSGQPGRSTDQQILGEFRAWMLGLDQDTLDHVLGVSNVEEPLRLLRAFARHKGILV